nr:HAD family hydrolase [Leptospira yasudae]
MFFASGAPMFRVIHRSFDYQKRGVFLLCIAVILSFVFLPLFGQGTPQTNQQNSGQTTTPSSTSNSSTTGTSANTQTRTQPTTTSSSATDPLLRGSWFADQEQKESILYNRVMRLFRPDAHFVWKTDSRGRNYRFYKDGRVEFLIDREYREVFPDSSELDVHTREAKSLADHGEPYSAIRLLKGIGLCYRFQFGKLAPEESRKAGEDLSRLMKHMAHKRLETDDLTDPYGCIKKNILKLESEPFRFSLETTDEWKHYFPELELPESGTEGDHLWKVRRFYIDVPADSGADEWEKNYRSQAEKFLYYRPDRISLTIGVTYHPVASVYTSKNYFQLWDLKRGINPRTIREMNFRRKKEDDSYASRFDFFHKDGRKVPIMILEKYYLRENRGLLFSVAGPEKQIDRIRQIWSQLNQKLVVE